MPQMAPLSWLTLMITFIIIFYSFNMMNYYSFLYKNKVHTEKSITKTKINWKW